MEPIGPKIAEGRDSEIYEHGPGRVLRLPRDGRSLVAEADIMRFVGSTAIPYLASTMLAGDTWSWTDWLDRRCSNRR